MKTPVFCHISNFSPEYPGTFVDALLCLAQHSRDDFQAQTLCIFPEEARERSWLKRFKDKGVDYGFVPRTRNVVGQLRNLLHGYNPLVFHTHFFLYDLCPVLLKVRSYREFRHSKIIWHYHNPANVKFPQRLKDIVKLQLLGSYFGNSCIAVGDGVYESLLKVGLSRDKLHLIHNGVATERFLPNEALRVSGRRALGIAENQFVYLLLGLDPLRKGVDVFIKAALDLVRSSVPNVLFLVVGRKETQAFVRNLPEYASVERKLKVIDPTEDVATLFGSVDVLVSASKSEGLAYSVLESMAAERLVLSSDIPGVQQSYGPAQGVWLFPNKDWAALAKLMGKSRELSLAERRHLGQLNSRYIQERYSLQIWAEKVTHIYSSILGRPELS
jgi:glycosyltransferase involved in cell wall biosynthesis